MGKKTYLLGIVAAVIASPVFAGTYATISIDGSFADWADAPVVASDPADATGVDYADIKVANDDSFVYVYINLHSAADAFTATSN